MTITKDLDLEDLEKSLTSLDRWVDAFKDISLVSVGILASYSSLAYGGAIEISLILIILAVSILSSIFLPYKIAVTRNSTLGAFSRYRAIELMIVIFISWLVPFALFLAFPEIMSYLPPQSESRFVSRLLTFFLPPIAFLSIILFSAYGLKKLFGRIGVTSAFFEKHGEYTWGLGYISLWLVSLTVINTQLLLLEAVQAYAQSIDLAVLFYARAFGGLIVLILLCCTLTYYEPKRILTLKGNTLFGVIGLGVLIASIVPFFGFMVSMIGVLVLIWYSLSLPPPDIDSMMAQKERIKKHDDLGAMLYRIKYGRKAAVLYYTRTIFIIISMAGLLILVLVDFADQFLILTPFMLVGFSAWFILYMVESVEKLRLFKRVMDHFGSANEGEDISQQELIDVIME